MIEFLSIPSWNGEPRSVDDWATALSNAFGQDPVIELDGSDAAWIELAAFQLRAFAMIENGLATAVNFEFHNPDLTETLPRVETAAESLSWEVHPDDEDEIEED
jgi:hypothetical protein